MGEKVARANLPAAPEVLKSFDTSAGGESIQMKEEEVIQRGGTKRHQNANAEREDGEKKKKPKEREKKKPKRPRRRKPKGKQNKKVQIDMNLVAAAADKAARQPSSGKKEMDFELESDPSLKTIEVGTKIDDMIEILEAKIKSRVIVTYEEKIACQQFFVQNKRASKDKKQKLTSLINELNNGGAEEIKKRDTPRFKPLELPNKIDDEDHLLELFNESSSGPNYEVKLHKLKTLVLTTDDDEVTHFWNDLLVESGYERPNAYFLKPHPRSHLKKSLNKPLIH